MQSPQVRSARLEVGRNRLAKSVPTCVTISTALALVLLVGGMCASDRVGNRAEPPVRAPLLPATESLDSAGAARPSTSTAGQIVSTIDLVANRVDPGNQQPAVQELPNSAVFDSLNQKLYVRGLPGNAISVVNASTLLVEATIATGDVNTEYGCGPYYSVYFPKVPTTVVDTTTGELFASNSCNGTVTPIDPRADSVGAPIVVGGAPYGMGFDPASGDVYVLNWTGTNITLISGSTHAILGSIAVGKNPYAVVYDNASDQMFVADYGSANVTVINATSNRVVASLTTGSGPVALALDTVDDEVDVANGSDAGGNWQSHVTVIAAASDSILRNISVGSGAAALAYDPAQDEMVVANGGSQNVSIINQITGSVVATIGTYGQDDGGVIYDASNGEAWVLDYGRPQLIALDLANNTVMTSISITNATYSAFAVSNQTGDLFAVDEGNGFIGPTSPIIEPNVTVINPGTDRPTATTPLNVYPQGATYDPANSDLIVADPTGDDAYVIDSATDHVVDIVPAGQVPICSAYDPRSGELFVVDARTNAVTVLNLSLDIVTTLGTGDTPTAIAYDPANGFVYVTNEYGGNVSVFNGSNNSVEGSIPVGGSFPWLSSIVYDSHTEELYVADENSDTVAVLNGTSRQATIAVGIYPTSLAFDSKNDTVFVTNIGSTANTSSVDVINDTTRTVVKSIPAFAPNLLAYDSASDILYVAPSGLGWVAAYNASSYGEIGTPLSLGTTDYPSGIAYDPANRDLYVSDYGANSISIIAENASGSAASYPVIFVESGLPDGRTWSVSLGDTVESDTVQAGLPANITFLESNGTYSYHTGAVTGFTVAPRSGPVLVNGSASLIEVTFTALPVATFAVNFMETSLPSGTNWSVTLGTTSQSSPTGSIEFSEPNGTYPFVVNTPAGFGASPPSGSISVNGSGVPQTVAFEAIPVPLSANFSYQIQYASCLTDGGVTNFVVLDAQAVGGSPPYSYNWTLPTGSATTALASTTTTYGQGNTVTLAVSDATGRTATHSAVLPMELPPCRPPALKSTASTPLSLDQWAIIGLVVALVTVSGVAVWLGVRGKGGGSDNG
jgi:YVTN family beta-propeller protein